MTNPSIRLLPGKSPTITARLHLLALRVCQGFGRAPQIRKLLNPTVAILGAVFAKPVTATLSVTGLFEVDLPLSDAYWVTAALEGRYENDIFTLFSRLETKRTLFMDCGANIGWWCLMAEKAWGWDCVAIEPSGPLMKRLLKARQRNNAHFKTLRKAVWKTDEERLDFKSSAAAHAGGHVANVTGFVSDRRVPVVETVDSVTIDKLFQYFSGDGGYERRVIKLDVEGAEAEAIAGGQRSLRSGAILIYEDHGRDRSCVPTAMVLRIGMEVYSLAHGLRPISSVKEAVAEKLDRRRGYNFVAVYRDSEAAVEIQRLSQGHR